MGEVARLKGVAQRRNEKFDGALWLIQNKTTLKVHGVVYFCYFFTLSHLYYRGLKKLRHSTSRELFFFIVIMLGLKMFIAFELRPFFYFTKVAKIAQLCASI